MENYLNYWLIKLVKDTPNDAQLGEKLRNLADKQLHKTPLQNKHDRDEKWIVEQYNRNRDPKDWI